MGYIKVKKDIAPKENYYLIWDQKTGDNQPTRIMNIPPPKMKLPEHVESYNPPKEFLFTPGQEKEWREGDVTKRRINFIPKKYLSLLVLLCRFFQHFPMK